MTSQEKLNLIRSYIDNYHTTTGEHIKIAPCTKWEAMATFTEKADFWKLVAVIFDLTGWNKKGTFGKGRLEERIFRRGIIDFIAVYNGCSYSMCARFTQRDHTSVINSVRKFEQRLETDSHTRAFFKEVTDYVRENYYIHGDQNINSAEL